MSDEKLHVDSDYKQAFNQGYELASELGLKSDILNNMAAGNNRIMAMRDGMQQYETELEKGKAKEVISEIDLDNIDDRSIDLKTSSQPSKDKDRDIEK